MVDLHPLCRLIGRTWRAAMGGAEDQRTELEFREGKGREVR